MKEKDAPELAALERECFAKGWNEDQYRLLLRAIESARGEAAKAPWAVWGVRDASGELVAYISLGVYAGTGELEVFNIAVRKERRRQGLGGELLRHALDWAFAAGFTQAFLEVREGNSAALALYASAGFQASGRRRGYYADNNEDALVLCCSVRDRPWHDTLK